MYDQLAAVYDSIWSSKNYRQEAKELQTVIARHKQSKGKHLLDVGCGTGGHITYLKHHFKVEGLDISRKMLNIARKKHPDVMFHQGDMVEFDVGRRFDVIISLFASISYVRTKNRLHKAISCMSRHLFPGGLLIIEEWTSAKTFRPGLFARLVDLPNVKIAGMTISRVNRGICITDMNYMVGTAKKISQFIEHHEKALFTEEQYLRAIRSSGLRATLDKKTFSSGTLFIGLKPAQKK